MVISNQTGTWAYVDTAINFAVDESARILSRLRDVRAASDMITSASNRLHDLLEQIEQASLQSETSELLGDARLSVQTSASALKDLNADDLTGHLSSAKRHMKELQFIALMIKIDTAAPSHATSKSSEFAYDLAALVTVLDSTTKTAMARVEPIHDHIRDAYRALHDTTVGLTRQVEDIAKQKDNSAALERARDSQMRELSQGSRQISDDTTAQISQLIPRLQFADAFVQRLQNARNFIEDAKDHPGTEKQDVMAVAAQQLQALCQDTRLERQASTAALDLLLDAASQSPSLLASDYNSDGFGAWLQANSTAVSLNTQVIRASHSQLLSAFRKIDDAHAVAEQVNESISKFAPLVQTLKYTAINGSLIASKSSATSGAAKVLTAEIQNIGTQCGRRMTDSAASLVHIKDILAQVDRSEIEARIGQLADGLDGAKAAQESLQHLTSELNLSRQSLSEGVNALLDACRDARQTIQDGEEIVQDLERLISTDIGLDTSRITAHDVLWISDYYTTEPERALHHLLFGGEATIEVETPDMDDDLADFML